MKRKFNPVHLRHVTVLERSSGTFRELLVVKVAPTGVRCMSGFSGLLLVDVLNVKLGTSLRVAGNRVGDTLSSGESWRAYVSGFNFVTGDILLHGRPGANLGAFVVTYFSDKHFSSIIPIKYQALPGAALVAQGVTSEDIIVDSIKGNKLQAGETLLSYTLALLADSIRTIDLNLLLMVTTSVVDSASRLTLSIDELEQRQQIVVVPDFPFTRLSSHKLHPETGIPYGAQVPLGLDTRVLHRDTSKGGVNFVSRIATLDLPYIVSVDANPCDPVGMLVIEGSSQDLSKVIQLNQKTDP